MRHAGSVVADRYVLEHLLGEGGMASVWAATHRMTGRAVALKFLACDRAQLEEAQARFLREARAVSLVRHPNVVPVHDVITLADGTLVMVMERLFGETLRERLDHLGRLMPDEAAALMLPVISAVGTAHAAGVIHRDLKPENIFITDQEEAKVLDFGIAKLTASEQQGNLTNTGALLGTPYYMAPEQIFGERDVDARIDVWSLGVILYECLTGERPFEGDNAGQIMKAVLVGRYVRPSARVADLPQELVTLLEAMLAVDRERREPDLTEAYAVLSRFSPTEAVPFGQAVAPRFLAPSLTPPRASSSRSTRRREEASAPLSETAAATSASDPGHALTERMPSSSDPGVTDLAATHSPRAALPTETASSRADTLATAGQQERSSGAAERSGRRSAIFALALAALAALGYFAWPRTGANEAAVAPLAEEPATLPASPAAEYAPPTELAPEPTVAASEAPSEADPPEDPPLPRRPTARPKAPSPPQPAPLPHNIQRDVPF